MWVAADAAAADAADAAAAVVTMHCSMSFQWVDAAFIHLYRNVEWCVHSFSISQWPSIDVGRHKKTTSAYVSIVKTRNEM